MALRAARFAFKTHYNIGGDHVAYSELLGVDFVNGSKDNDEGWHCALRALLSRLVII